MIETFGSPMFFAAGAMHLLNLWLITRRGLRNHHLDTPDGYVAAMRNQTAEAPRMTRAMAREMINR